MGNLGISIFNIAISLKYIIVEKNILPRNQFEI